jgi:hypothetical protein
VAVKREAENARIVLPGESKGVKRHNRRAKALLARGGVQRLAVRRTPTPAAP